MINPLFFTCVVQAAAVLAVPVSAPEQPKVMKVVARGAWPHLAVHAFSAGPRKQQQSVLRSEKELALAAGAHALPALTRDLKVKHLGFEKQMMVVVADGTLPMVGVSGGAPPSVPYSIDILRAETDGQGKVLTVFWRFAPRDPAREVITYPLAAALVERFDGEVRFERLPTEGSKPPGKEKPEVPKGKEVKVLARAFWPEGWKAEMPPQQWAVRSYQELIDPRLRAPEHVLEAMRRENAARYARALGVDAIDFGRHMIIGVSAGVQASGGYRVEVVRVERGPDGKGPIVFWKLHLPRPDPAISQTLSHPAEVVLVEQFPGSLRFERIQE